MPRFLQRVLTLLCVASLSCGSPGRPSLQLHGVTTSLPADGVSTTAVIATAFTNDDTPVSGSITFSTTDGILEDADVDALTVSVPLDSNATATIHARCRLRNGLPATDAFLVTAVLQSTTGDELARNSLQVTCVPAEDRSVLVFSRPVHNALHDSAGGARALVYAIDTNGRGTLAPVLVTGPGGVTFSLRPYGPVTPASEGLQIIPGAGAVEFWVNYPGDAVTMQGPFPVTLTASFTNRLGRVLTASHGFSFGLALNNAFVGFSGYSRVSGNAAFVGDSSRRLALNAGASDLNILFTVMVKGRDGLAPPPGTLVTVRCLPEVGVAQENCETLRSFVPDLPEDQQPQQRSTEVRIVAVPEEIPDAPDQISLARFIFSPSDLTTPGIVRLHASFRPIHALADAETSPDTQAVIQFGDPSAFAASVEVENREFRSDVGQQGVLRLHPTIGVEPAYARLMCASIGESSGGIAVLSDGADDVGRSSVVLPSHGVTDGGILVRATSVASRGTVEVRYTVVNTEYGTAMDDDSLVDPCAGHPGIARVEGTEVFHIDRDAILGSIRFISATPPTIGVRGSTSLPTLSAVKFQVYDDALMPVGSGLIVDFWFTTTPEDIAVVSSLAFTDDDGVVTAHVNAGDTPERLVIQATSRLRGIEVTGTSDPITVVSDP